MVLGLSPRQPLPEPRAEFSFAVDVPTARSSASAAANLRLGEPMARVTCSDANRHSSQAAMSSPSLKFVHEFTAVQDAFETTCPVSRNIALASWLGIAGWGLP